MQTSLASGVVGTSHFHMYFYGHHIHLVWDNDWSSMISRPVHAGDDPQDTAMQWKEEICY